MDYRQQGRANDTARSAAVADLAATARAFGIQPEPKPRAGKDGRNYTVYQIADLAKVPSEVLQQHLNAEGECDGLKGYRNNQGYSFTRTAYDRLLRTLQRYRK